MCCLQKKTQKLLFVETGKRTSLVAQIVKNLPAIHETQVQSLSLEDPLEKGMATHSSILAWMIPWTEESDGYSPWGHKESDMTKQLNTYTLKCSSTEE